jgi:hypothetical protein
MFETIDLPDVLSDSEMDAPDATNERADGRETARELDFDLSRNAVPISGIFTEPASVEELELVQRLFFLSLDHSPRVAVFCSVGPRDCAAYVCARTGEILASQSSEAVCLVDANLREPKLHQRYDLDGAFRGAGVKPQMEQNPAASNGGGGLWVLPASALRERCPGLPPDRVRARLTALRSRFGFLLIYAPSLDSAADGFLLGQMSDGIVLHLEARGTRRDAAVKTRHLIEAYNIRLLGAVMNQLQEADSRLWPWKLMERVRSKFL